MKDIYKTIENPSQEALFKEKGSKFFGYAFLILSEDDVKHALLGLKKKHPTASHFCYAWQLGTETSHYRVSDDGEPSNSAGMPIYGQLQAFEVTNVLVVSVRYFGGTKLGVGGLIQAYKHSDQLALEEANVVERTIDVLFQLNFGYDLMNKVMRIVKERNVTILSQELGVSCLYCISISKKDDDKRFQLFS